MKAKQATKPVDAAEDGTARNKQLVREFLNALDEQNYEMVDMMVADDFSMVISGITHRLDKKAAITVAKEIYTAFPDNYQIIEDLIAEDDKVAVRLTFSGTHKGDFRGVSPTGKAVEYEGIQIWKIKESKIVEGWFQEDLVMLMRQIGVELPKQVANP